LKTGGVLRIVIPDLSYYVDKYIKEKKSEYSSVAADNFMNSLNIITNSRDPHMWMYDNESIIRKLHEVGFVDVKKCEYKSGKCVDIDILDYLPEESLWVEAIK
jgi:predicted SAM-dependent methyltransferase